MKVALLTHSVLLRGAVVHTLALGDALTDRGHDVTVLAPAEPGQRLFRTPRCRVQLLPMAALRCPLVAQVAARIAALVRALPPVLADGRFELLHAQDSLNGNALAELADTPRGRALPPWLRTVHHLDAFDAPELIAWQQRGWRAARAIGCVSDTWCRHFGQELGVPAQRLYNGVDLDRFGPAPEHSDADALAALGVVDDGAPIVLALGGIEARKNSTRLLQAFAHARRHDRLLSDARLAMAGGASLLDHGPALAQWHAELGAQGLAEGPAGPVWRPGPIAEAAVPALMRRARLLAMPSLNEGFGLVALEALACGTPVLVSRRPPFTEHLLGCAQVAWCDPLDVLDIAGGLQAAARLPQVDETPAVCGEHAWSRSAAVHERWYHEVLADASPRIEAHSVH